VGLVQELLGRGSSVDSATKVLLVLVELVFLRQRKALTASFPSYSLQRLLGHHDS
jgi:hypothetical protein